MVFSQLPHHLLTSISTRITMHFEENNNFEYSAQTGNVTLLRMTFVFAFPHLKQAHMLHLWACVNRVVQTCVYVDTEMVKIAACKKKEEESISSIWFPLKWYSVKTNAVELLTAYSAVDEALFWWVVSAVSYQQPGCCHIDTVINQQHVNNRVQLFKASFILKEMKKMITKAWTRLQGPQFEFNASNIAGVTGARFPPCCVTASVSNTHKQVFDSWRHRLLCFDRAVLSVPEFRDRNESVTLPGRCCRRASLAPGFFFHRATADTCGCGSECWWRFWYRNKQISKNLWLFLFNYVMPLFKLPMMCAPNSHIIISGLWIVVFCELTRICRTNF